MSWLCTCCVVYALKACFLTCVVCTVILVPLCCGTVTASSGWLLNPNGTYRETGTVITLPMKRLR